MHVFLQVKHLCDLTSTLRGANNCLLYNANNLLKVRIMHD